MARKNLRRRIERLRGDGERNPARAGELARLEERRDDAVARVNAYRPDIHWLARFGKKGKHGSRRRARNELRAQAFRAEMAERKRRADLRTLREAENADAPPTLLERLKSALFGDPKEEP